MIGSFDWYFKFTRKAIAIAKLLFIPHDWSVWRRAGKKKEERKRERGGFLLPLWPNLSPNPFIFSCLLFFAPPALSERLEKSILGLKDSSVAAGNNATTVLFSKEALGSLSATRLLIIWQFWLDNRYQDNSIVCFHRRNQTLFSFLPSGQESHLPIEMLIDPDFGFFRIFLKRLRQIYLTQLTDF